jgi:hypothetical protein
MASHWTADPPPEVEWNPIMEAELSILERIVRKYLSPQRVALRARMILDLNVTKGDIAATKSRCGRTRQR